MSQKWVFLIGSNTDHQFATELIQSLSPLQMKIDLHVVSAHRDPDLLNQVLRENEADTELFIAGAGLSAHLPGVVASQIRKPVIGLAFKNMFDGLDSWCSLWQMPFGVPVLSVYPYQKGREEFINFLRVWKREVFLTQSKPSSVLEKKSIGIYDPYQYLGQPFLQREQASFHECLDFFQLETHVYDPKSQYQPEVLISLINPLDLLRDSKLSIPQGSIIVPVVPDTDREKISTLMESWPVFQNHAPWMGSNMLANALVAVMQLRGCGHEQSELIKRIRREGSV
jgi:phosphoribosylaminoimidazole carboxylase PurE protein